MVFCFVSGQNTAHSCDHFNSEIRDNLERPRLPWTTSTLKFGGGDRTPLFPLETSGFASQSWELITFLFQHMYPVDLRILVKCEHGKILPNGLNPKLPEAGQKLWHTTSQDSRFWDPAEPKKADPCFQVTMTRDSPVHILHCARRWLTWENTHCWPHSLFQKNFVLCWKFLCLFYLLGISCCFYEQAHSYKCHPHHHHHRHRDLSQHPGVHLQSEKDFLTKHKSWLCAITKTS